ncbi:amidohydrolase, putative [Leishmania donovani]|uniref:Amidohydrolase, putative n=1 Tax=Leishmania donovani TaxID=5661 RepID=A0A3Q8IJC1_LEIDO|nr:amidohydrolase, putative [Leishmania donovani]
MNAYADVYRARSVYPLSILLTHVPRNSPPPHIPPPSLSHKIMPVPFQQLMCEVRATADETIKWRRYIHQYPELSFKEFRTAAFVAETLRSFGCPALAVTHPVPTAVVANLTGGAGDGPIVALRADMDALPGDEETDLPFKSQNTGAMHACGHDAHTAMLLSAAKVICAHQADIKGSVRFIFQHAEELLPGGAKDLVAAGVMEGVKSIFGMHCSPRYEAGTVGLMPGINTSYTDFFKLIIRGRGGHASTPQLLVDPVPITAEIVMAIQTITARKIDPRVVPVVSITTMTTGPNESHNVIPNEVKLMGTVRSRDKAVREQVPRDIERIASNIAAAHGAAATLDFTFGYDCCDNDPEVTAQVRCIGERILGSANIIDPKVPLYGGEDFSAYQLEKPGCFLWLGTANKSQGICEMCHSTKFRVDETALPIGVSFHVGYVYDNVMA